MKNWLYIPFLVLMAVTYTRLVDNYNDDQSFSMRRGPASIQAQDIKLNEDCEDTAARFNPHLLKKCL